MSYANICQACCISHANNSFNPPKDAHKYYHHSHWTVGGTKAHGRNNQPLNIRARFQPLAVWPLWLVTYLAQTDVHRLGVEDRFVAVKEHDSDPGYGGRGVTSCCGSWLVVSMGRGSACFPVTDFFQYAFNHVLLFWVLCTLWGFNCNWKMGHKSHRADAT